MSDNVADNKPDTAADYKLRNPDIRQGDICPECDEEVWHANGVCYYCVCGCDLCEP